MDNKREIIKRIEGLGLRHGHERAFRDWCEMMALAIQNGCDLLKGEKWESREQRYLDIMASYTAEEKSEFPRMFAYLCDMLEREPFQDALGQIYMELFSNRTKNKALGQCFTPLHLAIACGIISVGELQKEKLDGYSISNPLTMNDCAVGGGAMVIGGLKALHEAGFDWQRKCKVTCNDLDKLCVHMCYVQLSLIGARAVVLHQDTMTQEVFDSFTTPMENLWPATLCYDEAEHAEIEPETAQICTEQAEPIRAQVEPPKRNTEHSVHPKQLTLF